MSRYKLRLDKRMGERYYEHRAMAAWKLGRSLSSTEVVHHINGDTSDNHPDNLLVFPSQRCICSDTITSGGNKRVCSTCSPLRKYYEHTSRAPQIQGETCASFAVPLAETTAKIAKCEVHIRAHPPPCHARAGSDAGT